MKLVKKLPDPFPLTDGNRVASVEDWKVRRSETEGVDDDWANPEGTSVSVLATQPIYDFLKVADRNAIAEEDAKALMMLCDECFFGCSREADLSQTLPQTSSPDTLFDWDSPLQPRGFLWGSSERTRYIGRKPE